MTALGRPPLLPHGWIVFALFALNPIFWLLGLGDFIWAMASAPLLVWILLRPGLRRPPAVAIYGIYVAWAAVTILRVDTPPRLVLALLRLAAYATALMLAYYVYNERRVSRSRFVSWVAMFWVWAIIGGYAGLLFPRARLSITPAYLLLPRSVTSVDYVDNLVRPRLAQVQNLFGIDIPRPATLFAFTNEWGGNVGLMTPFFIAATIYSGNPTKRRLGIVGLVVAVPPMLLSVNRGLWLSAALIFGVVALRSFVAGRTAPLKAFAASIAAIAVILVVTPLGQIVAGRLSEPDASARAGIYAEAWQGAKDSPIFGWGGPRPSSNPFSPAVGTHGHVWFTMFSHGLIGLALYVTWIVSALYCVSRRHDRVSIMLASVVFVGALQMMFYNMLPVSIPIMMVALGLTFRTDDDHLTLTNDPDASFADAEPSRARAVT